MTKPKYEDFELESQTIMSWTREAIDNILLSKDRMDKHDPWTWMDEPQDEHLHKCMRHIITYQLMRDGLQKEDSENHLELAVCRLAMAFTQSELSIKDNK